MIEKVRKITSDPLKAAHDDEERLLLDELALHDSLRLETEEGHETHSKKKVCHSCMMETEILENTLSKIGALLAMGFGEAGCQVIAKNMKMGEINPMIPGIKEVYIFGFCDIRNFTDCTEVLEEGVMLFVNEIGAIVHGIIAQYSGAANKNVGDAFLLAWKIPIEC